MRDKTLDNYVSYWYGVGRTRIIKVSSYYRKYYENIIYYHLIKLYFGKHYYSWYNTHHHIQTCDNNTKGSGDTMRNTQHVHHLYPKTVPNTKETLL